jgi:hypothetical protein
MREKLNSNPLMQAAVIGVLLVLVGIFVLSSMGGGGGEGEPSTTATSSVSVTTPSGEASVSATVTTPEGVPAAEASAVPTSIASAPEVPAPPLPHAVKAAFASNRTVVLLFVRKGAYEDKLLSHEFRRVRAMPRVSAFTVPAKQIARYAAIAQGVKIDRVPALVVIRPQDLDHGVHVASVSYGIQSVDSAKQAVRDARYKGRTLSYHP